MTVTTWNLTAQDGSVHHVALEWGYWMGRREVSVDGALVDSSTIPFRWKSTQSFDVGGTSCVVRTRPSDKRSWFFRVSLEADGVEVPPNEDPSFWERPGEDHDEGAAAAISAAAVSG